MKKVVFIDTVHPILNERLEENGFTCIDATSMDEIGIKHEISDAIGIVIRSRFKMDQDFLKPAKKLKFIARSGAGMENIDLDYCIINDIAALNAPEGNRNAVAEHILGMLLSLFNNISQGDNQVSDGKWDREGNRGVELDGRTIGIIGLGNNGAAFAKKLRGFDVEILAYDKYKSGFGDEFVTEVSMEQIFMHADVISFHIPQNQETIGLVNKDFLENFKKPIYLINAARGKIVQTSALVEALKTQAVLGACLDVLENEKSSFESFFTQKMPEDLEFLLNSENVLITPHVAGWTHESYYKLSDVLADKILNLDLTDQ